MFIWIMFIIYILMSAGGLFILKQGTADTSIALQKGLFNLQLSTKLIIGFFMYASSFLLSLYVMSRMKLSLFYPIATGAVLIITCILSRLFLKEQIGVPQYIGIALILGGVIAMNIN